jgi:hypothetical protein
VLYRLIDLDLPFIYSRLHTSYKMLRDRPEIVQRAVAAFAEIVYFVEKIPTKPKLLGHFKTAGLLLPPSERKHQTAAVE